MMSFHESFLLLGSNIGDRLQQLHDARVHIAEKAGRICKHSDIYETAAWGIESQPSFLNQVLVIETTLSPELLIHTLLQIEQALGRIRNTKMGPRTIDIDLLFYDELIYQSSSLTLPHPLLHLRRFTLLPLAALQPEKVHPVLQRTISELLKVCPDPLPAEPLKGIIHNPSA